MWIISKTGFVSLVEHDEDQHLIRARARRREHLLATFNFLTDADIIDYGIDAPDYRWHANVPRPLAAEAILNGVMDVNYSSHVKEEVAGADNVMYRAMLDCWTALHRLQDPPKTDGDWWTNRYDRWDEEDEPFYRGGRVAWYDDPRPEPVDPDAALTDLTGKLADKMLNPPKRGKAPKGTSFEAQLRRTTDLLSGLSGPRKQQINPKFGDAPFDDSWDPFDDVEEPELEKITAADELECEVCGETIDSGEKFVNLPDDGDNGEAPAHIECAEAEGYSVKSR